MNFIVVAIIIISGISLIFLFYKRPKAERHLLLISFYLVIFFIFFNFYSALHQIDWLYAVTNVIASGSGYLLGGVMHLLVISLFRKLNIRNYAYNLLPFFVHSLLIGIPFSLSNPTDGFFFDYLLYVQEYGDEIYLMELLTFFLFVYSAYLNTNQFSRYSENYYSNISKDQITWVKHLLLGTFIFLLIDFGQTIYLIFSNDMAFPEIEITLFSSAFIIAYISYHGLYLSKIFVLEFKQSGQNKREEISEKSIAFSGTEIDTLKNNLQHLLEVKKVYLNDALTLSDLASSLSIPEKKLSYFINHVMNTNFYEIINNARLEDFKLRIANAENKIYSIVAIANECGFKSKTSFYSFFKKKEGKTPSQYLKHISGL